MSTTQLLVLGAVHVFQPVHGYLIRRELLTWDANRWAHVNPGSIYNALRTGVRDGTLAETSSGERAGGPARTTYSLTADGEDRFLSLLRRALWEPDPFHPQGLLAALSFFLVLPRAEVLQALRVRAQRLEALVAEASLGARLVADERLKPAHVSEHYRCGAALAGGELAWCRELLGRVAAGEYLFAGEPGPRHPGADGRWPATPLVKLDERVIEEQHSPA